MNLDWIEGDINSLGKTFITFKLERKLSHQKNLFYQSLATWTFQNTSSTCGVSDTSHWICTYIMLRICSFCCIITLKKGNVHLEHFRIHGDYYYLGKLVKKNCKYNFCRVLVSWFKIYLHQTPYMSPRKKG